MNKARFCICKSKIAYGFHYANLIGNISKHLFVLFAGLGYTHKAVNHSQEYVTAEGVHTNHIESLWRDAKIEIHEWSKAFVSAVLSGRMAMARSKDQCLQDLVTKQRSMFKDLVAAIATNPKYQV